MQDRVSVSWPWRLLLTTGVLLGFVLVVYAGLTLGYETYLNSSISSLNSKLDSLSLQVSPADRQGFTSFYSQLTNLQKLLGSHVVSSQVFPLFEGMTDPNVVYNSFNLSVPDNAVSISGTAQDYATLANQLYLYKQSPQVSSVILESSSLSGKVVAFTIKLTLNHAGLNL
ncbi:MAG: PilN domain-containing protein [Patescibacteria group bacterium]|nr:PilN domain-containing protein [Patescibacteria group bacterium]MCL5224376.1 PilN domain-containing protein [Patescibacteria group bacterium]